MAQPVSQPAVYANGLNRRRGGLQMWCGINGILFNIKEWELSPSAYIVIGLTDYSSGLTLTII
jgi:hypothetical protein